LSSYIFEAIKFNHNLFVHTIIRFYCYIISHK